jgi:hypothetical protein
MKRGILNIVDVIQRENSQGFLLSGGGNDILDGNRLTLLLRPYTPDPSGGPLYKTAQDYIITHRLDAYLTEIIASFAHLVSGRVSRLRDRGDDQNCGCCDDPPRHGASPRN